MRTGFETIVTLDHISVKWLFECNGYYWTFGDDYTHDGKLYESKIITSSFTGISEHVCKPADNQIAPNETSFAIAFEKNDHQSSSLQNELVDIRMLIDNVEMSKWTFYVKSCYYSYGQFNFICEDFLQKYIFNTEFPDKALINGFNNTSATFSGDDGACIPEVYGTPFVPLRPIPHEGEWLYVLGMAGTYTISQLSSPIDFDYKSDYPSSEHTFTQSAVNGLQVYTNNFGTGGTNATFLSSGKICDLPTQYSNSDTVAMTNPADIITDILLKLGLPSTRIDSTGTFASAKTLFDAQGLSFDVAFTTREEALKVLCRLLVSCNSIFQRTDKVLLIPLEDDLSVKTLTREHIKEFSFSPKVYTENYDAGYAQYFTEIQAGDPVEIPVAVDGGSFSNISSDKVLMPCLYDTQMIQKLGIIYYRRKYLQTGTVSFSSNFSLLDVQVGDRVTISDDLYEDYENSYIDSITIQPDLSLSLSLTAYSDVIGDLTDYSPAVISQATAGGDVIVPLANRWLKSIYIRSETTPSKPEGENPAGWTETVPADSGLLYESVCWFGNDNKPLAGSEWSVPVQKEGYQGIQGPQGDQGVKGDAGIDGQTSYFHVRYADDSVGTGMNDTAGDYVGTYADYIATDSDDPAKYNWVLWKGSQGDNGEQGIPGINGVNGQTSYLHIKYSDDGISFTANNGETIGDYVGMYVDFTSQDSSVFSDYTWKKIKGEQGLQGLQGLQGEDGKDGIQGPPGENGNTTYFHVKYATGPDGTGMNETGGDYIGTYVDFEATDSTNQSSYTWVLTKGVQGPTGNQGIPGTNGINGLTSYLHIKYSDNGTSFTANNGETPGAYIGQYVDFTEADSTSFSNYTWTIIKGADGAPGEKGDTGPGLTYTGEWSSSKQYYTTSIKRDIVKSGNNFYACKQTHTNVDVTNTTYWEGISAFQSIATGILLADDATILRTLIIGTSEDGQHLSNCSIRSGQTGFDVGNGWFLGRDGGDAKFSLRNENGAYLKFDNNNLEVSGLTVNGAVGIGSFTDASLSNIDTTASNKLATIAENADVTDYTSINNTAQEKANAAEAAANTYTNNNADMTTVTTISNALNGQAMITTGAIQNGAGTFNINFDTGELNINKSGGLKVNSSGGLKVNSSGGINVGSGGGININSGGDVNLISSEGDESILNFFSDSGEQTCRMTAFQDNFYIQSNNQYVGLYCTKFKNMQFSTYDSINLKSDDMVAISTKNGLMQTSDYNKLENNQLCFNDVSGSLYVYWKDSTGAVRSKKLGP